jgi:upstream activation factor subunit UAF30
MARPTRGGSTKKKAPVKKRSPKKKSVEKVKPEDYSDFELNSDGEVKEKKEKKGGFHKKYYLSAPLAELVGETAVCPKFPSDTCELEC